MRKILIFTLLGIFTFMLLGCEEKITTTAVTTVTDAITTLITGEATTTTAGQSSTTEFAGDICEIDPFDPSCITQNNIVLSYADWADPEINEAVAAAFMQKYPNITVDLRADIEGTGDVFTGNLINAQTAGVLPDVFAIDNVPTGIFNGMVMDVSQYWDMDEETDLIYDNIADTAIYGGMRLAMPSFQFLKGIMVNITLLEAYNIDIPDYDWTYEEWIDLARELRQAGKNDYVYGIEGWYGSLDFASMLPAQDFVDVGYNTFDGTEFHFTSQAWIDAYNLQLSMYDQNIVVDFTEEELATIGDVWAFRDGYAGFYIQGSWQLGLIDQMWDDKNYEVGFWPYPGGDAGQFPPTILDFVCVSSQTEHPLEAYLLAKWMTWGREGWLSRLDALESRGDNYPDRFPIADFPDVWARSADVFNDYEFIEGMSAIVDNLDNAKPDVDKWLAGYKQFWEWVGNEENDYWNKIADGLVTPEVFAATWETELNDRIQTAMQEIIDQYGE